MPTTCDRSTATKLGAQKIHPDDAEVVMMEMARREQLDFDEEVASDQDDDDNDDDDDSVGQSDSEDASEGDSPVCSDDENGF